MHCTKQVSYSLLGAHAHPDCSARQGNAPGDIGCRRTGAARGCRQSPWPTLAQPGCSAARASCQQRQPRRKHARLAPRTPAAPRAYRTLRKRAAAWRARVRSGCAPMQASLRIHGHIWLTRLRLKAGIGICQACLVTQHPHSLRLLRRSPAGAVQATAGSPARGSAVCA